MTHALTLYSRPGCHLCDVMKDVVARAIANDESRLDIRLDLVNIDLDRELVHLYDDQVPVLMLNGRKIAKYRIDERELRKALEARERT